MNRALLPLLWLVSGCVIGSNKYQRPRDLEDSWLVDRTRLLAVRVEPPEIAPGETATFEALLPQPDQDEPWPRVWFACPVSEDGAGFGCNLDLGGTGSVPTGLEDGFIGLEPGFPPAYTAPADLLDGLQDEGERREGVQVLAQVAALPPEFLDDPTVAIDFNDVEMGFKRLVVSEATTPNRNPVIDEFVIDRLSIPPHAEVVVTTGQQYELGVILEEDLVEEYEYLNSDGELEVRREEPYVDWFSTGGEVLEPITLYPYAESTWQAPDRPESGVWYAVVRDRRGGMTWHTQRWVAERR